MQEKEESDLSPFHSVMKKKLPLNIPELKEITLTVDHIDLLACTTASEVGLKALKLPIRL